MELIKDNILPQLDKFVEQDKERDLLLRILIKTIDEKEDQVRKLNYELEHERDSRLRYQHKVRELQEDNKTLDGIIKKDPFVTVLVDGDGAIFRNEFYDNPAHGAQKASVALQQEVRSHLKKTQLDADDVPILVRIFANLHGLAGKMRSLDIIESDKDMRIFAEYFNKSRAEFDMVDVGSGKENADAKMRKTLAQSIKNFQCRKIFFAGCHDAGYMHDLAEYQGDESNKSRIILLETTPAHHSFCEMGYEIVQFDRVFRSLPLESALKQVSSPTSPQTIQPISQEATSLANHGALPANSPQILLPFEAENLISSGKVGHSINYPNSSAVTYATVGLASGNQNISLVKNATAPLKIHRNAKGDRVDTALKAFNNDQVMNTYLRKLETIKPQGFCNEHHLLGRCERPSCKMNHETTLTDQETAFHRNRARQTLCGNGPLCERYGCYLSHHCPWDPCTYGKGCKFKTTKFGDLHYERTEKEIETVWAEDAAFPVHIRKQGSDISV
ncbi:hypothetical protein EYB26_009299 [Talaromyces marneffei]|uniref:uncharacterized protein n=1 Tax=Talaromyces marneffei TaxID=37727 RepID=UPI0012A84A89|nr:uncharacterized protein EYB26_009299 [Talaromyces marneffei]QGA21588.1 hypothetical protein EYB26_009299 [Talaromyces marneffei]